MHRLRILLAEDMAHERLVIETNLRKVLPANVQPDFTSVDHAEAAIERVRSFDFDLVILDIDFSKSERSRGMTGLEASHQIKVLKPDVYSVVVSSSEEEATMTKAIEDFGVDWYLRRSSISFEELGWLATQSLLHRLHREHSLLESQYRFMTENAGAKRVLRRVDAILPSQNTLIYGETGTGKELIARRIHANACAFAPKRPLKVLDCSALAPQLFEGEVFGHRKGAFTGAIQDRAGALQLVNGGDLFLDEIHNIPTFLQQKLLRVLNDGVFSPVGSNEEIKSKFRIIAATNIPIEEAISSGKLLPDFVERIRKIRVDLVPLRERPEDIPVVIESHLSAIGSFDKEFSADAVAYMRTLPWKGNIRELKSFIDTAIAEVKIPIISKAHLEKIFGHTDPKKELNSLIRVHESSQNAISAAIDSLVNNKVPLVDVISQVEKHYLTKASERFRSTRDMADAIGYNRGTLTKRLRDLGLALKK